MFSNVHEIIINTVFLENLKTFLSDCYPNLELQLHAIKKINAVLTLVRKELVTLIKIITLKQIIKHFNIQKAYEHIKKFIDEVCAKIKIH